MLIKVTTGTSFARHTTDPIDSSTTTLRSVLEKYNVDYNVGQTNLDGRPLTHNDLDKTFDQMGVTKNCYLLNVPKQDNA